MLRLVSLDKPDFDRFDDPTWAPLRTHHVMSSEMWSIMRPEGWQETLEWNLKSHVFEPPRWARK